MLKDCQPAIRMIKSKQYCGLSCAPVSHGINQPIKFKFDKTFNRADHRPPTDDEQTHPPASQPVNSINWANDDGENE